MIHAAIALVLTGAAFGSPVEAREPAQDSVAAGWRRIPEIESLDARLAAYGTALETVEDAELSGLLQLAFGEFMVQTREYHLEAARQLAEDMHARARAGWSAMSLALVCTRSGDSSRAEEILRLEIARTPEGPSQFELLERLGLAIQGGGDEAAALGPLGSAFARGSGNAGVVLGRIALREGRTLEARAIFRTLLTEDPPQSWALRGWGLSMLPPARPR